MQFQIIYLLFVFSFIDKSNSITVEEMIRESVGRGLKSLTQLKRELPEENMDEYSGEFISAAEKDSGEIITAEEKDSREIISAEGKDLKELISTEGKDSRKVISAEGRDLKELISAEGKDSRELISDVEKDYTTNEAPSLEQTPVRRELLNEKVKIPKTENKNCSCKHRHKTEQQEQETAKKARYLGPYDGFFVRARKPPSTITSPTPTQTIVSHPTSTSGLTSVSTPTGQLKDPHLELKEYNTIKEACPHYKRIPEIDIDNMVDVWQLAYYKALEGLTCFKIFMKKTSPQSRKRYKIRYTSFNETIDWKECQLELCSTGRRLNNMRHFLQGSKSDKGVLENIVLLSTTHDDKKVITLLDQAPDQWMVTKNLLLMRDCESGDVVIFTRMLSKPEKKELIDAMNAFGENGMDSTMPCRPQNDDGVKKESDMLHMKYFSTLSK